MPPSDSQKAIMWLTGYVEHLAFSDSRLPAARASVSSAVGDQHMSSNHQQVQCDGSETNRVAKENEIILTKQGNKDMRLLDAYLQYR